MVTLIRNIRLKDNILLPNGERVKVDLDVQSQLRRLIAAQNDTIIAAQEYAQDETSEEKRKTFYVAFGNLLHVILGKGFETALAAYDGNADELCVQLDEWVADEVAPRIMEASKAELERRKRQAKRLRRYASGK